MSLLLIYLFTALIISFLCSILEAVLLSTQVTYVKTKYPADNKIAKKFIEFKKNIEKPLSAILTLNTIAHTVGAAGVGAQAAVVFGEAYFGIVSAVLTILILVLTEIIPKTIGANYYKELFSVSVPVLSVMLFITYPLVAASSFISRLISKKENINTFGRDEFLAMANLGLEEGVFEEKENKIIQNLIKLKSVTIEEIKTPRVVMVVADENMCLSEFLKNKDFLHFSRIPVYNKSSDNISGYVFRETVFENLAEDKFGLKLKDIKREICIIPETSSVFNAWEKMLEKKEHIALVVDEYGGTDGIVTMEDIIETLLGFEIVDEKDTISNMQEYAKERWKNRKRKYNLLNEE